ncbi:MAG: purine-nucleoside phosphorylase [Bacteriovoracia bacterium]
MYQKIEEAAQYLRSKIAVTPEIGIVLGSGLGIYVDHIEDRITIPYTDIPHFHRTTVEGHDGRLIFGKVKGKSVVALSGRLHAYEGYPMEDVVLPVRVMALLGVKTLFVTNASGGINSNYHPGDLVIIEDHMNLSGRNPLVGPNLNQLGPRFPDMSEAYPKELRELLKASGKTHGIEMKSGVYCWLLGPTYETPAEIRMLAKLGGDMVGMSTVPEVIAAAHLGIRVAGVACITNYAAGLKPEKLNHADVKLVAQKAMAGFATVLTETIQGLK